MLGLCTLLALVAGSEVYIIRHAEKTSEAGCLDSDGQARAKALVGLFDGKSSPEHDTFDTPRALFAHNYDDGADRLPQRTRKERQENTV